MLCLPAAGGVRLLEQWQLQGAFQLSIPAAWQLNLVIGAWYRWKFQAEVEGEASSVETKGHHRIHPALAPNAPNQRVSLALAPKGPLGIHWY